MNATQTAKPENNVDQKQALVDKLLLDEGLKHGMRCLTNLSEKVFFESFVMFYNSYNDLKAYAYSLMIEESEGQLKTFDSKYDSRIDQLETKEEQATERLGRLTYQIVSLEKEIQGKEAEGNNVGDGIQAKMSRLLEEKKKHNTQLNEQLEKYARRKRIAERERGEERVSLLVNVRDCEAYLRSYFANPNSPVPRKVAVNQGISKYIYDTLTIEWAKRDAARDVEEEELRTREMQELKERETSRRRSLFRRGCFAVSALAFVAGLYLGISYLTPSKPVVPKKIETPSEVVESTEKIPFTSPSQESHPEWFIAKEIGVGEEIEPGIVYKGAFIRGHKMYLQFDTSRIHKGTANRNSGSLKQTNMEFDWEPDCKFQKKLIDFNAKNQRIRVIRRRISPAKKHRYEFTPVGPVYRFSETQITEIVSRGRPADGYAVKKDLIRGGNPFVEFFWYERNIFPQVPQLGFPTQRKKRIRNRIQFSPIHLSSRELDDRPDCYLSTGPNETLYIDVDENCHIRFLKRKR